MVILEHQLGGLNHNDSCTSVDQETSRPLLSLAENWFHFPIYEPEFVHYVLHFLILVDEIEFLLRSPKIEDKHVIHILFAHLIEILAK